MFEILCAVLAITIIGLAWPIWRPILLTTGFIAFSLFAVLLLIGGVAWLWQFVSETLTPGSSDMCMLIAAAVFCGGFLIFANFHDKALLRLGLMGKAKRLSEASPLFYTLVLLALLYGLGYAAYLIAFINT